MTTKFLFQTLNKASRTCILLFAVLISALFVTSCAMQGVTSDINTGKEQPKEVDITLEGGSGKAYINSPVHVEEKDGISYATLVWSSSNYDYIIVDGIRYDNENPGGSSTFTIPVKTFSEPLDLIGDTVAMSTPHEIEYRIIWNETESTDAAADDKKEISDAEAGFGIRDGSALLPVIDGIESPGRMPLSYAQGFDIYEYGKYRLVRIYGVGDYLLIPEGESAPPDILPEITYINRPCDRTYLVSTSVADLIRQIDALDMVKLCGLAEKDWRIKEVSDLMREGKIVYAGKYRSPDYELILSHECNLAIENTMIYHDPEVKEKLEELGIPVIVETSSYEKNVLGRLEWIKLYGVLFDREDEAEEFFAMQAEKIGSLPENPEYDKKVSIFYVSSNKMINVRSPLDYLAQMVETAGGTYVPSDSSAFSQSKMGTISIQMEDFYAQAGDADILIYNSTIDGEIDSIDDLTAKDPLFADFKAVKENSVYCLKGDFFQKTTGMADLLSDLYRLISGSAKTYTFIEKLE
ncbi:MAG: ABC transporter substrate-binding protein [Lachnospiraceae bacterium]|nr:ABC transporter substrate-binding protein [Lachnospiraceae bacterium]